MNLLPALIFAVAWAALACVSLPAPAQESNVRYVNDVIHIDLRDAPRRDAGTILVVPSGTQMLVLERDDESGFSRVRLESGMEGWVLHQYLTGQPIARDRLAAAQETAERMQAERDRARADLGRIERERSELAARSSALEGENRELKREVDEIRAANAGALELGARARSLEAGLESERKQREAAEARAAAAGTRVVVTGAIAAVLGLGIGFYIGSIPLRREKRWRSLG